MSQSDLCIVGAEALHIIFVSPVNKLRNIVKDSSLNKANLFADGDDIVIQCHYLEVEPRLKITRGKYYNLVFKDTLLALDVLRLLALKYPEATIVSQFKQ